MGKRNKKQTEKKEDPTEDRFDASKPQFRQHKEKASKVVLDDRFASVLTDPRFKLQLKDKYGRKEKKSAKDELSAFYVVQDENEDNEEGKRKLSHDNEQKSNDDDDETSTSSSSDRSAKETKSTNDIQDPASRIAFLTALSRGQVDVSSSDEDAGSKGDADSDSDSEVSDDGNEDPVYGAAGILDPETQEEIEITHEESSVLAVMNLDWTHMRAIDVLAIVSSFTPTGAVKRVRVFPSDFGMQRIAEEDQFGPRGLWKKKKVQSAELSDQNENDNDDNNLTTSYEDGEDDSGPDQEEIEHSDDDGSVSQDDKGDSIRNNNSEQREDDDPINGVAKEDKPNKEILQSEFDPEKLRAYEASKLKYYFAVVEFSSHIHADKAYREIDGMEFEHSSAAVDMRAIPMQSLPVVLEDRPVRDEATSLPSNYVPPEFIVNALQQTNVQCSWEAGDHERERVLTKYSSGMAWEAMTESDDIKAYLASDASSDEDEEDDANAKRGNLRKMLGLESDDEVVEGDHSGLEEGAGEHHSSASASIDGSESDVESNAEQDKEISFIPGKQDLERKIRSKLDAPKEEPTPWEKYKEKRKQKQKERKQAAREKEAEAKTSHRSDKKAGAHSGDSFFAPDDNTEDQRPVLSKAELELLVSGDGDGDEEKDYNMKDLERLEKHKGKKLTGSRKRKEENRALNTVGTDFQVDIQDDRFQAVLDGQDGRFGIDRTDPSFKETPAMRDILAEQTRRRQAKRQKKSEKISVQNDVIAEDSNEATKPSGGAAALSALVKSLKSKVSA